MKRVSFLFHMYQPAWQYPEVLNKISNESYYWLTDWFNRNPEFQPTININYSLTELLTIHGHDEVIDNLSYAHKKGNLEFTDSAGYHAFLPLISKEEIERQIDLNKQNEIITSNWSPKGFFPPEMGINKKVREVVKEKNYDWTITDSEIFEFFQQKSLPRNYISSFESLPIFFRNGYWSNQFSMSRPNNGNFDARSFIKDLSSNLDDNSYIILAMDLETIGHHHPYNSKTMDALLKTAQEEKIEFSTISNLLNKYQIVEYQDFEDTMMGSWSTSKNDLRNENYYPLWNGKNREIHKKHWELVNYAIELEKKYSLPNARNYLDKGLNSCQFWWGSQDRWNSDNLIKGLEDVNNFFNILPLTLEEKTKVNNISSKILTMAGK